MIEILIENIEIVQAKTGPKVKKTNIIQYNSKRRLQYCAVTATTTYVCMYWTIHHTVCRRCRTILKLTNQTMLEIVLHNVIRPEISKQLSVRQFYTLNPTVDWIWPFFWICYAETHRGLFWENSLFWAKSFLGQST